MDTWSRVWQIASVVGKECCPPCDHPIFSRSASDRCHYEIPWSWKGSGGDCSCSRSHRCWQDPCKVAAAKHSFTIEMAIIHEIVSQLSNSESFAIESIDWSSDWSTNKLGSQLPITCNISWSFAVRGRTCFIASFFCSTLTVLLRMRAVSLWVSSTAYLMLVYRIVLSLLNALSRSISKRLRVVSVTSSWWSPFVWFSHSWPPCWKFSATDLPIGERVMRLSSSSSLCRSISERSSAFSLSRWLHYRRSSSFSTRSWSC